MNLPAYVIALEKSVRFESLQQDLDLFNISFSKINAIKGSSLDEEFLESIVDLKSTHARLGHEISLPLIGCALSHKIVYKEFLRSEARWALVFEEDVRLESDIVSKVKEVQVFCETEVPRIIQLFTRGERFIKADSIISLSGGSSMFKFASIPGQAASYLINRKAAELAIESEKIDGPSDWPNWSAKVEFLGIFPYLASESGLGSTIPTKKVNQINYWGRNLQIVLGIHWIKYKDSFESFSDYKSLVIQPILNRVKWVARGKRTFPERNYDGLWLV